MSKPPHQSASATRSRQNIASRLSNYLIRHAQVMISSLGRLIRSPFASLMTVLVIGIAIALPTGLYVILINLQTVTAGWDGAAQISLFLRETATVESVDSFEKELKRMDEIDRVRFISKEEAMEEFKRLSGFGQALDALEDNPLPSVMVLKPSINQNTPEQLNKLVEKFGKHPVVELAQLDMQWVKRLYSIMEIVQRGVWVIAGLLCVAVLLVIGNTIRLDIQNRREEIVIIKLVGATNAFVRRPFLYTGTWYGLFGGLIAVLLISLSLAVLSQPVARLTALYQSQFQLEGLGFVGTISLVFSSTALGLIGSWIAVGRHLGSIEPT